MSIDSTDIPKEPYWDTSYLDLSQYRYVYYGSKTINAVVGRIVETDDAETRGLYRASIDLQRFPDAVHIHHYLDDIDEAMRWVEAMVRLNL